MYKNIHIDRANRKFWIRDDISGEYVKDLYPKGGRSFNRGYRKNPNGKFQTVDGTKCDEFPLGGKYSKDNRRDTSKFFECDVSLETRILIDLYGDSDDPPKDRLDFYFDIETETTDGFPDALSPTNKITSISYYWRYVNRSDGKDDPGEYIVLILDPDQKIKDSNDGNVTVISYENEEDLLKCFLSEMENLRPDTLTGWNIEFFDIPYLFARSRYILGNDWAKKLSPIGKVEWNRNGNRYDIAGVSCLDYIALYKKYTFIQQPSYRLDAIGRHEVELGKIEYEGTLDDLYKNDINKFIQYNLNDVEIVKLLEDKLKFIDLAVGISHKGHIPHEKAIFSSRFLEGAILTYTKQLNLITKNKDYLSKDEVGDVKYAGAYVKEPKPGLYKWVYDLDLTSLYPSIIMSLNISFETKVGRVKNWNIGNNEYVDQDADKEYEVVLGNYLKRNFSAEGFLDYLNKKKDSDKVYVLENINKFDYKYEKVSSVKERIAGFKDKLKSSVDKKEKKKISESLKNNVLLLGSFKIEKFTSKEFYNFIKEKNYSIAANGALYDLNKKGLIPAILENWFKERVDSKNLMKKYGKLMNESENPEYKKLYQFYKDKQYIQKVLLNSMYGALGLPTFRFFDIDNAEAITLSGQQLIKNTSARGNELYRNITNEEKDYCIYVDTDSNFFSSEPLIKHQFKNKELSDEEMVNATLKIADFIQSNINNWYTGYARKFHNIDSHKFEIKQEMIAKAGLWIAKKRYAQWIINDEGVKVNKIDIKGLDVIRSNYPAVFKNFMGQVLTDILSGKDNLYLDNKVLDFKKKLETHDINSIAKPTGVKGLSKYTMNLKLKQSKLDYSQITTNLKSEYELGTPVHVKAALFYNDFLRLNNLNKQYESIRSGDKIKWVYLKDNKYKSSIIAFKGYNDPPEVLDFIKKYIDYNKIFERELKTKLNDFYESLNWGKIPESHLTGVFFEF